MKLFRYSLRHVLHSLVLVWAISGVLSAQDLNSKLPNDPDVVTGKLANGLTYYIRNNHKPENKVELRLVVKAGSILENKDQLGLAHFMEHMNFNGTTNFQKNDLVSYLQSIGVKFGADLNANTGFDQTIYILPIPTDKPENLEKGFQIIEDWAHNALLTDKDIDEERGVVLEESRLGKGAEDRMMKKYFPKLAEGSLYAERLPIGKDEILKKFKYETIRSYYHDWYRPDLQAVIVVGDLDAATAKKMIEKHFAGLKNPANERERKYVDVTPRTKPDAMVVTDKEATNYVLRITFPLIKKHDQVTVGDYKEEMKRNLVNQMINQRLSDLAQGSNPPFVFAGVGFSGMVHGYEGFQAFAVFGSDGPAKTLNAVTGELSKAKKFGFTESELEVAKKDMISGYEKQYNERKTTESKDYVREYISAFTDKEPFPGIENEYGYCNAMLPTINLSDINGLIAKWMSNPNTFTLVTGPEKNDVKLPSDKELLEMTQKGFSQEITKTEERKVASSLMSVKPLPGKIVSQVKEEGFDATTYTLSNGVKVTIKPTEFKTDEILMTGVKKGGNGQYGLEDKSNVSFGTGVVESMGAGEFTPADLEKVTAGKEIKVNMFIGSIQTSINASSTVKDFESMLQLAYLRMEQPRKDEGLFKAYKDKQMTMVQFMSARPEMAFSDTIQKVLYNFNPLVGGAIPTREDYDKINLDRVLQIFHNEVSLADGYHFFIVGNINPETAKPLIETYLGSLPVSMKPVGFKDNGVRRIKGVKEITVKKGTEKKSAIRSIYWGEMPYSEENDLKVQALTEVLNIKVIEELREKMGAIYGGGFNGSTVKDPYEYYNVQLQLPCGPENVDKLIAGAKELINNVKTHGPDAKDLDKVKSQWHEKHLTDVKENKYWTGKLQSTLFWGRDKDRVLNYENYVNKLTPKDIQEMANLIFNGKNEFTAVLYPES